MNYNSTVAQVANTTSSLIKGLAPGISACHLEAKLDLSRRG